MDGRITLAKTKFAEGVAFLGVSDYENAEQSFRSAVLIDPTQAESHTNLAYILAAGSQFDEALWHYEKAIELQPSSPSILNLYATCLAQLKRLSEAEVLYKKALNLDPQASNIWNNFGVLLASSKRDQAAEECYRHAIELDPYAYSPRFNLAYVLLRQGRYSEGWKQLEARASFRKLKESMTIPCWSGESLHEKSLLIILEGGLGDMIQFCRYVDEVRGIGCQSICLVCQPQLQRVLAISLSVERVVTIDEEIEFNSFDYWIPIFSLPRLFNTEIHNIPNRLPYLHVPEHESNFWAEKLDSVGNGLKIGIAWKGNPRFENDYDRSIDSVGQLISVLSKRGATLYSLQKNVSIEEIDEIKNGKLIDLSPMLEDFATTAAVIEHLDLVISVDTAVAHLAGALAKPCWVLLPYFKTDWRWLREEYTHSPWYPGCIQLFRQKTMGGWGEVFAQVGALLEGLLAQRD